MHSIGILIYLVVVLSPHNNDSYNFVKEIVDLVEAALFKIYKNSSFLPEI